MPKRNRFYQARIDGRNLRSGEQNYFNTMGTKGGSEEIGNLLHYMQNSQENFVTDDTTRELHEYVRRVRVQPEVKLEYMRFDEIIAYERQDAAQEATLKTTQMSIVELLVEYGEIPEALRAQIDAEQSLEVLKRWLKLAAKVNSVDEFLEKM